MRRKGFLAVNSFGKEKNFNKATEAEKTAKPYAKLNKRPKIWPSVENRSINIVEGLRKTTLEEDTTSEACHHVNLTENNNNKKVSKAMLTERAIQKGATLLKAVGSPIKAQDLVVTLTRWLEKAPTALQHLK